MVCATDVPCPRAGLGGGGGGDPSWEIFNVNLAHAKLSTEMYYIPVDLPSKSSMTLRFCLVFGMVMLKSLIW